MLNEAQLGTMHTLALLQLFTAFLIFSKWAVALIASLSNMILLLMKYSSSTEEMIFSISDNNLADFSSFI
ncbi:hypothetical protein ASE80_13430 [Pseudomonas sp. Leaf15]|nr:hypothetical protein ASE80_13430 [Pseudomonas sp. Leaf15]RAH01893.1 hypothetical protein DJ480_15670 [Pseudomonas sp. Leaf98]